MEYINYKRILSYTQALAYFICGGRDTGKTFGARKAAIENFFRQKNKGLTNGKFCAICRYKDAKADVERDYFTKLRIKGFFTDYEFMWKSDVAYYRKIDSDSEWEEIGYCVALTEYQTLKQSTFTGLDNGFIIFDECILESNDRYHRYLKDEFSTYFLSVLSSLLREDISNIGKTKIFLLGNSVDLICPYFEAFDITYKMLNNYGIYWCNNGTVLFWNVEPLFSENEIEQTIVGRLGQNSNALDMIFNNQFLSNTNEFICERPNGSKLLGGIVFNKVNFSIWIFGRTVFISSKVPKNTRMYSLLYDDGKINYKAIKRGSALTDYIKAAYYDNSLWYDYPQTREQFYSLLKFIGVR